METGTGAEIKQDVPGEELPDRPNESLLLVVSNIGHERHAAIARKKAKVRDYGWDGQIGETIFNGPAKVFADSGIAIFETDEAVEITITEVEIDGDRGVSTDAQSSQLRPPDCPQRRLDPFQTWSVFRNTEIFPDPRSESHAIPRSTTD